MNNEQGEEYISLSTIAQELDVVQGTIQYFLKQLKIKRYKFELDRNAYILVSDYERIKVLRSQSGKNGKKVGTPTIVQSRKDDAA